MTFRIVRETEVGAAGVFGNVVNAAVGIDFQHERHAVAVDTKIATPKARTLESDEAEVYFRALLEACGISPVPGNWRERVQVGSDRKRSGTARENLTGIAVDLPDSLPERHRRLVDYAAPGLRQLLGYV